MPKSTVSQSQAESVRGDGTFAGGYAQLNGAGFTGAVAPGVVALADAATIGINAQLGNDFRVTISASRTISNPVNPADGQVIHFQITQGGSGSNTITWGGAYDFGTTGAPALSTAAGKIDVVGFKYNATAAAWLCLGSALGF